MGSDQCTGIVPEDVEATTLLGSGLSRLSAWKAGSAVKRRRVCSAVRAPDHGMMAEGIVQPRTTKPGKLSVRV